MTATGSSDREAVVEHDMDVEDLLVLAGNDALEEVREEYDGDPPTPATLSVEVEVQLREVVDVDGEEVEDA